jgi:hypothetical protein
MARPTTVAEYLSSLPPDRRSALDAVRKAVNRNLPRGYEEGIQYGMISWTIPLSRYPETYNGQALTLAALASQKSYMALYLHCVYQDPALLRELTEWYRRSGKRLDMGKACVRFKSLDDLPLDAVAAVIGRTSVDEFIATYERARAGTSSAKKTAKKKPGQKAPAKKAPAKKAAKKRAAAR